MHSPLESRKRTCLPPDIFIILSFVHGSGTIILILLGEMRFRLEIEFMICRIVDHSSRFEGGYGVITLILLGRTLCRSGSRKPSFLRMGRGRLLIRGLGIIILI